MTLKVFRVSFVTRKEVPFVDFLDPPEDIHHNHFITCSSRSKALDIVKKSVGVNGSKFKVEYVGDA